MKKLSFLAVLLPLLFCACSSFIEENSAPIIPAISDLQAGFADETRTYVENGRYLRWHEDDRLTAFYGNTLNRQYKFKGKTGDNSGSFAHVPSGDLETGNAFDRIYALYPYNETTTITDEGEISLTLPAMQSYAENSFGRGANTMIAVTENLEDTFLAFKNACGYLKLKLYNADGATIKSIEVKGNNGEKIAGAATATIAFGEAPVVAMTDDATDTIMLDCGDGMSLGTTAETATEFWTVIPQTTFTKGVTIKITDSQGGIFEKSTDNEVAITRNAIQPMAAVEVKVAPAGPANNEIWYTNGSTTKATTPYNTDVFGAKIISNTYNAEKESWVIKFDGEVTSIGDKAFYNCSSLTSVTIPDSVTTIGGNAFRYCSSLTNVTIPDSVTTIGNYAFFNCSGLKSITIPDSVTSIGSDAFEDCKLTSVYITELSAWCKIDFKTDYSNPLSTYIKTNLYLNNELVTELVIPSDITEIKSYAFYYCSSLTSVIIPNSVTTIGESAFWACDSLTSVIIPDSVTTIADKAFKGGNKLTSVYCMAKTPPSLGNNGFDQNDPIYVPYISVVEYRTATNWSKYADNIVAYDFEKGEVVNSKPENSEIWYKNGSSTEATLPYKTYVFGANIISNTYDVENGCWVIKFDGEVTTIGYWAFWNCENLTSVIIPDSVTTIGENAFQYCNLTSITIPDSVTTIADDAFSYCELTSVTIPGSVTEMGSAFQYCSKLTSVTFGNGVTTIGRFAFNTCESLTSVTIPDSVTKIGSGAFSGCKKLKSIAIPDSVTMIGEEAFRYCSSITSITIPDGVTMIDEFTFDGCQKLTSITIPDSVTSIGRYAFRYCSSLTSITIPNGVTTIGNNAFQSCPSLTSVTVPNSLTTIGYFAFSDCTNLTEFKGKFASEDGRSLIIDGVLNSFAPAGLIEYTIPNSVTSIADYAFSYCSSLTSVTIPDSVTTIGYWAFWNCENLTSVIIPDSVTTIGEYAFESCSSLTSVTIPDSVTLIGRWAFCNCNSLASVYCKAITPPAISIGYYSNWEAFGANTSARKIYVPAESVEVYKTADGWSEYASNIVGYNF